jgi:hypothetical protein
MPCLAVGCRALLGLVLAIAVVGKLRGRAEFARSVRQMNVLPPFLTRPVAAAVVVGELGTVLALAVPTRESGLIGFCLAGALLSAPRRRPAGPAARARWRLR